MFSDQCVSALTDIGHARVQLDNQDHLVVETVDGNFLVCLQHYSMCTTCNVVLINSALCTSGVAL